MRRTPGPAAVILCAALVLPWVGGIAIGLHHGHSPHHQEPSAHDAEALDLIVHGHHHEPGAPAHQHQLGLGKQSPGTTRPTVLLDTATLPSCRPPIPAAALVVRNVLNDTAHAPPPGAAAPTNLRI